MVDEIPSALLKKQRNMRMPSWSLGTRLKILIAKGEEVNQTLHLGNDNNYETI